MKDRIKKFWEDNKVEIIAAVSLGVFAGAAMAIGYQFGYKDASVHRGTHYYDDANEVDVIDLVQNNGKSVQLFKKM